MAIRQAFSLSPLGTRRPGRTRKSQLSCDSKASDDEPDTFSSLPDELLTLVAEALDGHSLGRFAAACSMCRAAAHAQLRVAIRLAVRNCLLKPYGNGQISAQLLLCKYFALPDDLVLLPSGALNRAKYLKELTIPASFTAIGDGAFKGCTSIEELTLPLGLKSVGNYCFRECASLLKLTLPDALTTIGEHGAFGGCSGMPHRARTPDLQDPEQLCYSHL